MNEADKPVTIMIVDDNPMNLRLLSSLLHDEGYRVVAFPGGVQALAAAEQSPPDLILLDIRMPKMDGFEICRRIKADISLQDIPVLFITALTEAEDKMQAFAAGGADYITKPFHPEEVSARVQTHLKNRFMQVKLQRHNLELENLVEKRTHELTVAHNRLNFALLAAKAGVWEWDLLTQKNYWSEEIWRLFNLKPHCCEPSYDTWLASVHPDDREKIGAAILKAHRTASRFNIEWRVAGHEDAEYWLMSYGQPFFDIGGQPERYIGIVIDITERKQAERERLMLEVRLQQTQKMEAIGSLAGGIAHDLNNILFPISGLSEILLNEFPSNSHTHEMVQQIHHSAMRGSDLVKQILAFSRQSNTTKIPIRIQPILKEVLNLIRSTLSRNVDIISRIMPKGGMVVADATQLHQVVMNLITNATHAVEQKGGVIQVSLQEIFINSESLAFDTLPAGRYICLSVTDNGTGIEKSAMERIFTPYYTTKALGKGTGLGLSVVLGIVRDHGGDVRVYSEIGKGTTFNVYLPCLDVPDDSETSISVRQFPTGTEHILLIDDEEPILNMVQMMLQQLGYRITTSKNGRNALDLFMADPDAFDLVISDRGMPQMTGEQLVQEILAIRPGMPIILCTGFCNEDDERLLRKMGVQGLLLKPVFKADMAETIRCVLDKNVKASTSANL